MPPMPISVDRKADTLLDVFGFFQHIVRLAAIPYPQCRISEPLGSFRFTETAFTTESGRDSPFFINAGRISPITVKRANHDLKAGRIRVCLSSIRYCGRDMTIHMTGSE